MKNKNAYLNVTFISIVFVNTVFFSAYYVLKDPLAYILYSQGILLKEAYSIATTANTLLALSSLYFSFVLHDCSKQKLSLIVGIALSIFSIFLLSLKKQSLSQ